MPAKGATPEDTAAAVIEEERRGILDEPIPAFGSQTPRQAAANPALRAKLVAWTKLSGVPNRPAKPSFRPRRRRQLDDPRVGSHRVALRSAPARPPLDSPEDSLADDFDEVAPWELLPDPPPYPIAHGDFHEAGELMARALQSFKSTDHPSDYFSDLEYPSFRFCRNCPKSRRTRCSRPGSFRSAIGWCFAMPREAHDRQR